MAGTPREPIELPDPDAIARAVGEALRDGDSELVETVRTALEAIGSAAKSDSSGAIKAVSFLEDEPDSPALQEHLARKIDAIIQTGGAHSVGGTAIEQLFLIVQPADGGDLAGGGGEGNALDRYRRWLMKRCESFSLFGMDASCPREDNVDLARVYIGLDTRTPRAQEGEPGDEADKPAAERLRAEPGNLSAVEAVAANERTVILGDPGSGKSTFVNHFCLALASGRAGERLPDWPESERDRLPVRLVLRDFGVWLRKQPADPDHPDDETRVADFLEEEFGRHGHEDWARAILGAIEAGEAMLFFDGLDEIADPKLRERARDGIAAFLDFHEGCRAVVTCRVRTYEDAGGLRWGGGADWHFDDDTFPPHVLAAFDSEKIDRFIRAWYAERRNLPRDRGVLVRSLLRAVRQRELKRLAPNPLLLTMMTQLHGGKAGMLPDSRAKLYDEIVDLLLYRWDARNLGENAAAQKPLWKLVEDAGGLTRDMIKDTLAEVARAIHESAAAASDSGASATTEEKDGETADIPESLLREKLLPLHPGGGIAWVEAVIAAMKNRAGLLIERDERDGFSIFTFPHRTIQEYLAGSAIARTDYALAVQEAITKPDSLPHWRVALVLGAGYIAHVDRKPAQLLPAVEELGSGIRKPSLHLDRVRLAGEILAEAGPTVRGLSQGDKLFRRIGGWLGRLMIDPEVPVRERAEAGRLLGRLDPDLPGATRTRLVTREKEESSIAIPAFEWSAWIEPEPFLMGSDDHHGDEKPRFTCTRLEREGRYRISRFPVTVAQFDCFVRTGGYDPEGVGRWWTAAGRKWLKEREILGPEEYGEAFQALNAPRTGVSWYEAVAFCRWYNEAIREGGESGFDPIALPAEAQWERAARGADGDRDYPWQWKKDLRDRKPEELANIWQTEIKATSPAGMFPEGAAECGAEDLSGNVLEWCRTEWRKDYKDYNNAANDSEDGSCVRVWRGGSWLYDPNLARCTFRDWFNPSSGTTSSVFEWCPPRFFVNLRTVHL